MSSDSTAFLKPALWQIPPTDDWQQSSVFLSRVQQLEECLRTISQKHSVVKLASSLAAEDLVLMDVVLRLQLPITIFCLNTGRLHAETLAVIAKIQAHYGYDIEVWEPQAQAVDDFVNAYGLNAFYESVDLRKKCCAIRKVEPLSRALQGAQAWITGQRRGQSVTRTALMPEEFDEIHQLSKYNPLAEWSELDVWSYVKSYAIPLNDLHLIGYPSVGCEPCTRPVKKGEDIRAGRWWWEQENSKECGLHVSR